MKISLSRQEMSNYFKVFNNMVQADGRCLEDPKQMVPFYRYKDGWAKLVYLNMEIFQKEFKKVNAKTNEKIEGSEEYDKEYMEFLDRHTMRSKPKGKQEVGPIKRDKDGRPTIDNSTPAFRHDDEQIKIKYKDYLERKAKQQQEIDEMLIKPIEIFVYEIHRDLLPENISPTQVKTIEKLITDYIEPPLMGQHESFGYTDKVTYKAIVPVTFKDLWRMFFHSEIEIVLDVLTEFKIGKSKTVVIDKIIAPLFKKRKPRARKMTVSKPH